MRNFITLFFLIGQLTNANAAPPIEAYGQLPSVRSMAISPDGAHLAYLVNSEEGEFLSIYNFKDGPVGSVGASKLKARGVSFAGPDHVIIEVSMTARVSGFRGKFEHSGAFAYNLRNNNIVQLLSRVVNLHPAQTGLGYIVGIHKKSNDVFMPAFIGDQFSDPPYNLLKADLDNGLASIFHPGNVDTQDWFVDTDGTILAREDYSDKRNQYSVWTKKSGDWVKIYSKTAEIAPISLIGIKSDRSALIFSDRKQSDGFTALFQMQFDGTILPPIFSRTDSGIGSVLLDQNRVVFGVEYDGLYPFYEFFDSEIEKLVNSVAKLHPDSAVTLTDWSSDFNKLVFYVAGGPTVPAYFVLDRTTLKLTRVVNAYNNITDKDVGELSTIEYKARDGLTIPAIITWPPYVENRKNLPLIVIPHGGPEAYDAIGFDWMAQYFANRGYLVFQPNFRGSTGFGAKFRDAGRGEWGRKMQDDITDGVKALIKTGSADKDRICIVGASYGGYAALAGGAFTPDLYQCVAAIAPVADLPKMLIDERSDNGKDSWVLTYWKTVIGDPKSEREKLEAISPADHADAFTAPVLLLHGDDDTVVPFRQSTIMEGALKKAGKEVTLIKLEGEDHWLSTGETRLQTLQELDRFVTATIGAN